MQTRLVAVEAEHPRLSRDVKILRMHLDGVEQDDIAAAFGRKSHSWASEQIARIVALALKGEQAAEDIVRICARPGCGEIVERLPKKHAPFPPIYHHAKCANLHRLERFRARRRGASSVATSVAGSSVATSVVGRHGKPIAIVRRGDIDVRRIDQGGP